MQHGMWRVALLVLVIPGLLLLTACAKKQVTSDTSLTTLSEETAGDTGQAVVETPAVDQQALEEERLAEEKRQREDRRQAARRQFVEENIHFDFDSSVLRADAQEILMRKADWLRNNPAAGVIIEGHCDERGTNEYNLALGDRRAESARSFLLDLGIAGSRLTTISYGEERPLDPGHNEAAWDKNRRAHFVLD